MRARFGDAMPWGTLSVNVLGSFAMGLLWVLSARAPVELRLLLGTGVLGGFTTWSAFNQETLLLVAEGRARDAALSVALTLLCGLGAGWLGMGIGRALGG